MLCQICNKEYISIKALSSHIRQSHNISSKEYYDSYMKKENEGICLTCKKSTQFASLSSGYYSYCCNKCVGSNIELKKQRVNTFKQNPLNSEKARQNMIKYNQSELGRQNSSKVAKRLNPLIMKQNHEKYDKIVWCKKCQTNTKHIIGIGCMSCYNKSESHKESIIKSVKEKYGEEYINVYQVPEIKEKITKQSLEKYGTSNPGNSREARIKANYTMRGNGNGSSCEDMFEQYLIDNNINYKKQYKSEKYPFLCDFYLIDSDTYIELNIYWSHNNHYFDSSNKNDIKTLELWKQKAKEGHKQYQNAINVWTNKDLQKRQIAIDNNLNYIVLWTVEEVKNFMKIKKLK